MINMLKIVWFLGAALLTYVGNAQPGGLVASEPW